MAGSDTDAGTSLPDSADTGADTADTAPVCEPEPLPEVPAERVIQLVATVFDPAKLCWERRTIEVDSMWWSAWAEAHQCNDIGVTYPRVDCSCLLFSSQCAHVSDPAFADGLAAYERCKDAEQRYPECP